MKRDMDLARRILLEVEAMTADDPVKQYGTPEEALHVALLKEAGLLEAYVAEDEAGRPHVGIPLRLTWAGYDFLDAARSDTAWKKAKEKVIMPGLSWTFSLLLEFLKREAGRRIFGEAP